MATAPPFPPGLRDKLTAWFAQYGSNPLFEIECRVQDVGGAGFERVLQGLLSHKGWSNAPIKPHHSLDMVHANGVRETMTYDGSANSFMGKVKTEDVKVETPIGHAVRFQVSSESEVSAAPPPVHMFRHKERFTFMHKQLFKFELTRVKQGPTDAAARQADTQFEVELEFCGQETPDANRPEYLADSMAMKVADLLQQLSRADQSGGAGLKRQRTGASSDGPLAEGDEVELAEGTEVLLEPSGHGAPLRYAGEMPSELVPRWVFSHKEEDGRVHVMSEACRIGEEHFPILYFVGTVPAASCSRRQ